MVLEEVGWDVMNKINSTQDRDWWRVLANTIIFFGFQKDGEFIDQLRDYQLFKKDFWNQFLVLQKVFLLQNIEFYHHPDHRSPPVDRIPSQFSSITICTTHILILILSLNLHLQFASGVFKRFPNQNDVGTYHCLHACYICHPACLSLINHRIYAQKDL